MCLWLGWAKSLGEGSPKGRWLQLLQPPVLNIFPHALWLGTFVQGQLAGPGSMDGVIVSLKDVLIQVPKSPPMSPLFSIIIDGVKGLALLLYRAGSS